MKIYAHRGSSTIWPENTLFAFDRAHHAGVTGFETDLRLSRDQEIILSHDDNLARFGHAGVTVSELASEEVTQVEISSLDGRHVDKIITLRTLLTLYPDKDYIFDFKSSDRRLFEKLKELLSEIDFHDRVWVLTWSKVADLRAQKVFPAFTILPRLPRSTLWALASIVGLGRILEPAAPVVSLPAYFKGLPLFSRRQIQSIRARGKIFLGYIVNSEKELNRCQKCGVDYLLTDRPDFLGSALS